MAKSTGNVVNPFFALNRFGVDVMRFYLAVEGGISHDADYNNEYIIERYKKGLFGGLGGLTSRVLRGKGWNVRRAVERAAKGELDFEGSEAVRAQYKMMVDAVANATERMDRLDVGGAVKKVLSMIYAVRPLINLPTDKSTNKPKTNAFLQTTQPWSLTSQTPTPTPTQQLEIDTIIFLAADAIRLSCILLQPVMPDKMAQLADMLGVEEGRRGVGFVGVGKDGGYGVPGVELGRGLVGVLFPPLVSDR